MDLPSYMDMAWFKGPRPRNNIFWGCLWCDMTLIFSSFLNTDEAAVGVIKAE